MPKVVFTSALARFFPDLQTAKFEGNTVAEILENIEKKHPNIKDYLVDEAGHLRKHINIFVKEQMIKDRKQLSDEVKTSDEVLIFQALSGG